MVEDCFGGAVVERSGYRDFLGVGVIIERS